MAIEEEENLEEGEGEGEETEEPGFGEPTGMPEPLKEHIKEKSKDYLEKEAEKRLSKEAGKEGVKEGEKAAGKEAAKETGKEAGKTAGKEAAKGAGKEAAEKAAGEAAKAGVKTAAKAGAEELAVGAGAVGGPAGEAVGITIAALIEAADRLGIFDLIWKVIKIILLALLIIFLGILGLFAITFYGKNLTGDWGQSPTRPIDIKNPVHYYDPLADLANAGSKEKKLKLLQDKTEDIMQQLEFQKREMGKMAPNEKIKKSIQLIDEMIPLIKEIAELGKQVDNSDLTKMSEEEKIKIEEKNKEIKKKIDEKFEEWNKKYEEFKKIAPMFGEYPYVNQYVSLLKANGINAEKRESAGDFWDTRTRDYGESYHYGYDINIPYGEKVLNFWPGKVYSIYYTWREGVDDNDMGVLVQSGNYYIYYSHIRAGTFMVNEKDQVQQGTPLGIVYEKHSPIHVDIKVRKDQIKGPFVDWGKEPLN